METLSSFVAFFFEWNGLSNNISFFYSIGCWLDFGEHCIYLKGSYDAVLKIIILCIWYNRICWHALMLKKHIIFQILYIIVGFWQA